MTEEQKAAAKKSWLDAVRETIYGMAAHDMSRAALRTRASMEHLFILITMGDLLGIPILPPYYSLRLLPYVVPQIATWKRRMLREKDVADAMFISSPCSTIASLEEDGCFQSISERFVLFVRIQKGRWRPIF